MIVREGRVTLEVPDPESFRAPTGDYVPSKAEVFYNPHVESCRDIAVAVARVIAGRLGRLRICDPFTGVGVRGLRYACEVEGVDLVVMGDASARAVELANANVRLNKPPVHVSVVRRDANVLLHEMRGKLNFIDMDPFGSPAPFVEAACSSLVRGGLLALTATDTAALCGSAPSACIRKYGAAPLRTEYCHELGVRILVGFVQRTAAKYDLAFLPLLAHQTRHQMRVYLIGERGATKADRIMAEIGFVSHCFSCSRRYLTKGMAAELPSRCACGTGLRHAGPLWLGPLFDRDFVLRVREEVLRMAYKQSREEAGMLTICSEEAVGPPTFYDVNVLASVAGRSPPRLSRVLQTIRGSGHFASRTIFSPTGFRTDAPYENVISIFL